MNIKEIRQLTGLTQTDFSTKYHIPRRSIENWEEERRQCPEYVQELLEFKVRYDLQEEL